MKDDAACRARTLAQEGAMRVDLCACGALQITLGPFSVRLSAQNCHSLYGVLSQALAHLPRHGGHPIQ